MKYLLLSTVLAWQLSIPAPVGACSLLAIECSASESLVMPRQPVRSSNIASIGYDAGSSTLEVEFVTGAVYQYYNVPKSVYEGLMNAKSHGSYFARYVKDAGYRYKEV
jgi:hypothetical protein